MKIIDNRKDYYDGTLLGQYRDTGLLWVRKPEKVYVDGIDRVRIYSNTWEFGPVDEKWPFGPNPIIPRVRGKELGISLNPEVMYIGFCGRVYMCVEVFLRDQYSRFQRGESVFCYSFDETVDAIGKVSGVSTRSWLDKTHDKGDHLKRAFEGFESPPGEYLKLWKQMMEEKKSPVFVARGPGWRTHTIVWNPILSGFNFPHVVDVHSAAQSIFQFFSSLASPEIEPPKVDDKTMAEIKGHGGEYSFRRLPGQKKRKGRPKKSHN